MTQIDKAKKSVSIKPAGKLSKDDERILEWTKKFVDRYRSALEALAKK
jgi:phosphoenolpyruvate carboxylase